MPFVKRGDLVDLGPIVAVVLQVHTSSEPHMGSQLVMDGNPVDCNAHYVASLLVGEDTVQYKFDVRFFWESRGCHVDVITVRRPGTGDGWKRVRILS